MNKRIFVADLLLLLTAAIWGLGFVAQRSGMQYVGPFTFNGVRFILGSLSLLPFIAWQKSRQRKTGSGTWAGTKGQSGRRTLLFSSFLAGSCLFIGVSLQQLGMMFTTAGNAGFITGLYVVLVPVFGIYLGRKTGLPTWLGALFTFGGLYFLSTQGGIGTINPGDIIIAVSSLFWAFHVLIIDRLVQRNDPIELSSGQFAFAGIYALISAFLLEPSLSSWLQRLDPQLLASGLFAWQSLPDLISGLAGGTVPHSLISSAMVPILYGGLASVGIGYTLQVVAQRIAPPAHASIILCLEGSFAAIGGIIILNEPLESWILLGFAMMLAGMLLSQWELVRRPR